MGIKSTFTKILPLSVFKLIIYLNAKTRPKHSLWKKKNNITKNMYFECFLIMLPVKTLKYMQRTLCLGKERTLRETCIMSVFKFLKYQKAKIANNTLYRE